MPTQANLRLVEGDTLLPVFFQLLDATGLPVDFGGNPCTFNARIAGTVTSVTCDTDVDGQGSFTPSTALVARPGMWPAWFTANGQSAPPSTHPYTLIVLPHTRDRSS